MWWDKRFKLSEHGDPYEKLWWPRLLEHEFEEYETFWIHHVVPLTNRIDPDVLQASRDWVAIRSDSELDSSIEQMAMAQYSAFYYFSRASLSILFGPHVYTEDAVLFLDLAQLNLRGFINASKKVFVSLRVAGYDLKIANTDSLVAIHRYRNAFAHTPRIARAYHVPEGYIPRWDKIPVDIHGRVTQHSWRSLQRLPEQDFLEPRAVFRDLRRDLLSEMKRVWRIVLETLDANRRSTAYRQLYHLDQHWCIPGKGGPRS